jgi:hypothetical protein
MTGVTKFEAVATKTCCHPAYDAMQHSRYILILGVCILLHVWAPGDGGLYRLHNVIIVGYFFLLFTIQIDHYNVNYILKTMDPLSVE